jgi:hypothetical protein
MSIFPLIAGAYAIVGHQAQAALDLWRQTFCLWRQVARWPDEM